MKRIGFDNDKYLSMQSAHIRERIEQFGDKLYLEFGGKLFDGYHASRVLPGFAPDSKLQMLLQLADQAEMIISINAADIERNKIRHDLGITYDQDCLSIWDRLNLGLLVCDVDGYPASISELLESFNPENLTTGRIVQDLLAAFF